VDASATVDADLLLAGGSLYDTEHGSLRSALDSALSSPSALGVAVDASGALVGSVTADEVLRALAAARTSGEVPR
jgi:osmoprotectant transport system ATP-binding protein